MLGGGGHWGEPLSGFVMDKTHLPYQTRSLHKDLEMQSFHYTVILKI